MCKKFLLALLFSLTLGFTPSAKADILSQSVTYSLDNQDYEGYFVQNEGFGDSQPLVVLIHDWDGLGDYEKRRAQMLAERGYSVFAVDLYGKGIRPTTTEESRQESGKLYSDRQAMRERLFAGVEEAQTMMGVDPDRVVAIGYCFGGAAALELARAGAELDGFVLFHGGLETPEGQNYQDVQGPILILHGSDDPVAPMTQVTSLATSLTEAGVDYDMEIYGNVKHSFTVWGAKGESSRYDAQADVKSWAALLEFLEEELR